MTITPWFVFKVWAFAGVFGMLWWAALFTPFQLEDDEDRLLSIIMFALCGPFAWFILLVLGVRHLINKRNGA